MAKELLTDTNETGTAQSTTLKSTKRVYVQGTGDLEDELDVDVDVDVDELDVDVDDVDIADVDEDVEDADVDAVVDADCKKTL